MISVSNEQLQQQLEYTLLKPSNRLSGISTRKIHQSTTPSLSQTIWPRWASRQFLSLAPCDFCLFPKLRGCRCESIEEMKEAVTKVIDTLNKRSSMGLCRSCCNGTTSALQPEEITSKGTRVSCVHYQFKMSTRKKSGNYWKVLRYSK